MILNSKNSCKREREVSLVYKVLTCLFIIVQTIFCSYASNKIELNEEQFKKLQSKLAYIDYAITANNAIARAEYSCLTLWYTQPRYRKSIINEIGHAIEKCLLGSNVYDSNDIVIFYIGMSPKDFTQAQYNAWLLYNYVDKVIRYNTDIKLDTVKEKLTKYSEDVDKSKLDKAAHDIGEYLKINGLLDAIKFYNGHREYDNTIGKYTIETINKKFFRNDDNTKRAGYTSFSYLGEIIIPYKDCIKGMDLYIADPSFFVIMKNNTIFAEHLNDNIGTVRNVLIANKYYNLPQLARFEMAANIKTLKTTYAIKDIYEHDLEVNSTQIQDVINWIKASVPKNYVGDRLIIKNEQDLRIRKHTDDG